MRKSNNCHQYKQFVKWFSLNIMESFWSLAWVGTMVNPWKGVAWIVLKALFFSMFTMHGQRSGLANTNRIDLKYA